MKSARADHHNYIKIAKGEKLLLKGTPCEDSLVERHQNSNYRSAEALLIENDGEALNLIEQVRTQCARGNVAEAERLACLALKDLKEPRTDVDFEFWIERAKIAYQNGKWTDAITRANQILTWSGLMPLTKITLLQLRGICHFEMGDWGQALSDIDSVRTLKLLFPKSQSSFYSEVLRIKILLRLQGPKSMANELATLWHQLQKGELNQNLDTVLTLLRLQIDFHRMSKYPFASLALASYYVANAMGDELYAAHALIDLKFSESESLSQNATAILNTQKNRFQKIDEILEKIASGNPSSESVKTILSAKLKHVKDKQNITNPRYLLIFSTFIFLDLNELKVSFPKVQKRSQEILEALSETQMTKAELFEKLWKINYKPDQHDIIVRNALSRTRKQSGLPLFSNDTVLALKDTYLLSIE